jgi:hypothetical protein
MTQAIIKQLRNNLFADRGDNIADALNFADTVFSASPDKPACYTALCVVMNTIANAIEKADAERPEQTAPAQLALDQLIDQQIKKWASAELDNHISDYLSANIEDHIELNEAIKNYMEYEFDITDAIKDALKDATISLDF